MKKKKVCFIAQFPPPIHGLSKAVDTLFNSRLNKEFVFEKVDITDNKNFLRNLISIWKSKADLFYFTISQTKFGNIRDLIILNLLKIQKKKCLIHLHGGYYRQLIEMDVSVWQRKCNYNAIKNISGAIVLGPSLKPIFRGMIDDSKIYIIPNCVDNEFLISKENFEKKLEIQKHKEVLDILYLSNFIRSKGYPEVLEMARLEKERVKGGAKKKFHFNFAGKFFKDSDSEFFENYIKINELQDFITYHGVVTGKQKKDLLQKCEIFILLTNYPNEGQPISILEAMGNGMVIVTTDHAGIPDIVIDKINGIVVEADRTFDTSTLYERITNIEMNYKIYAEENRLLCEEKFMEEQYLEQFEKLFGREIYT